MANIAFTLIISLDLPFLFFFFFLLFPQKSSTNAGLYICFLAGIFGYKQFTFFQYSLSYISKK